MKEDAIIWTIIVAVAGMLGFTAIVAYVYIDEIMGSYFIS